MAVVWLFLFLGATKLINLNSPAYQLMKTLALRTLVFSGIAVLLVFGSCQKDAAPPATPPVVPPPAQPFVPTKASIDSLLTGAYAFLSDYYQGQPDTNYGSGITNWALGGIGADEAYAGGAAPAQALTSIEEHSGIDPGNSFLAAKWQVCYAGIAKANYIIREVPLVKDGSEVGVVGQAAVAEARFLRGVYHFELAKIWRNVPYASDTATYQAGYYDLPNQSGGVLIPIWDKIEDDFTAAIASLPITRSQPYKANYYAAKAFLAKAYLYDHQYAKALPLLTDCISNGITADGQKYGLDILENNFNAATQNGEESVFAVQIVTNSASGSQSVNTDVVLNYPGSGFTGCCGVDVPSYSLVNAFKTNQKGLPETATDPDTGFPFYDDVNLVNDHGVPASAAYTPTVETVDARLDWTVGRRSIPFLDWGICGGESWTSGTLSPYISKKDAAYRAASQGAYSYSLIRVSALYLWRAECEVELGGLSAAESDVNVIRARASNPVNWVDNNGLPAANYLVGLYSGQFSSLGQDYARLLVLTEEQLEFAMEGQRFFDLQRHDGLYGGGAGIGFMASVLNTYYQADNRIANPALSKGSFTAGRDELYPIPSAQINLAGGKLKQNPNY
jgi:hypothetical protein